MVRVSKTRALSHTHTHWHGSHSKIIKWQFCNLKSSCLRDPVCSLLVSERPLSGRKVILRPERLSADFEQVNGTLLMTLRWRLSQHALDPAAVEGFQFTWTLLSKVKSAKEGLEDTVISQTQTVAPVRGVYND